MTCTCVTYTTRVWTEQIHLRAGCFLFFLFLVAPWGLWGLSFSTGDQTWAPCTVKHGASREFPTLIVFYSQFCSTTQPNSTTGWLTLWVWNCRHRGLTIGHTRFSTAQRVCIPSPCIVQESTIYIILWASAHIIKNETYGNAPKFRA